MCINTFPTLEKMDWLKPRHLSQTEVGHGLFQVELSFIPSLQNIWRISIGMLCCKYVYKHVLYDRTCFPLKHNLPHKFTLTAVYLHGLHAYRDI